jgi:hypothetical protein
MEYKTSPNPSTRRGTAKITSKHKLKKGLSIQLHIIYNIINEQNPALSTPSP